MTSETATTDAVPTGESSAGVGDAHMTEADARPTPDSATSAGASGAARRHGTFHPLRVSAVEPLTDEAVAISFEVPPELREDYAFAPGQHLTLQYEITGEDVRRNYSICAPAGSGRLQIAVKRLEGGAFSTYATSALRVGDVMEVMTPTGRFTVPIDPAHAKHYVAIAAGSGITPVLSILSTVLEAEPGSRCTLVYGNRTTRSVMFLEELADLKNRHPERLNLINVLSRESAEVELFSGRIDRDRVERLLATLVPAESVDEWFLCGPFAMVEAARAALTDAGTDPRHVHMELFHVEGEGPRAAAARPSGAAGADAAEVTVVLDGRSSTFHHEPDDGSVLDGALRVRSDAPYACKGGVCGTCRAKLLDGTVDMDVNYALEQDEVEAGFVLACQSHPTSKTVTLDFDQ
jgi:ring-1,2-phenylacetyl-CoA epoxidase subunit PaaE